MTPCAHSHSTRSGVLWPARLSHTSNSRSGGRSCGKVKGIVRPACHTAQAACVSAGSSDACGTGSIARISREPPVAAAPGLMRDETGSGSWLCRRGCIRAVAGPVALLAATTRRPVARPETAPPRPHTKRTAPVGRPVCRPARSAFFGRGIGIADAHHAVLALAHRYSGFAPGAALLPAQAGLVQRAPDRKGADLGQPVWSLAQGSLQQAQGPGGRAVRLALGRSCPFRQNALLRVSAIADPRSAPVARSHGSQPVAVEAADPGGDRLVVPSSDLVGRRRVASPISNGQQNSGALDLRGGSAERTAQAGQLLALIRGERAQGVFLVARHGTPRVTRITPSLERFQRTLNRLGDSQFRIGFPDDGR